MEPRKVLDKVTQLVGDHHQWFDQSLPMIASENVISPAARRFLVSDLHDRYAEGRPGKRYYQGLKYIDEVESLCEDLAQELLGAPYTDTRPVSGTVANMALYFALLKPGQRLAALSTAEGAHISHTRIGAAGVRGAELVHLPPDRDRLTVDGDRAAEVIRENEPQVVTVGQSAFLFPVPIQPIAEACDEVGATLHFDGAHVLGLIAGGQFQDPLREGAKVLTASTHKTLPGPQGGVLAAIPPEDEEEAAAWTKKLDRGVFPGVLSSHHLHHLAAKAIAFAEHLAHGEAYAAQVCKNAKALAEHMHGLGVEVWGERHGFTESHQVLVDVGRHGGGADVAQRMEDAGIITNMNMIPGDESPLRPSGIRLGVQELTRIGMKEGEMEEVASLLHRCIVKKENVKEDVATLREGFRNVHYCFSEEEAYRFWELS